MLSKTLQGYEAAKKRRGENLLPDLDENDEKVMDAVWDKARTVFGFLPTPSDAVNQVHQELMLSSNPTNNSAVKK